MELKLIFFYVIGIIFVIGQDFRTAANNKKREAAKQQQEKEFKSFLSNKIIVKKPNLTNLKLKLNIYKYINYLTIEEFKALFTFNTEIDPNNIESIEFNYNHLLINYKDGRSCWKDLKEYAINDYKAIYKY